MSLERYGPHSGVLDHDMGAALAELLAAAKGAVSYSSSSALRAHLAHRYDEPGFGEWLFSAIPR